MHIRKDDFAPWWPTEDEAPVERWPAPFPALVWLTVLAAGGYFWYEVIIACF